MKRLWNSLMLTFCAIILLAAAGCGGSQPAADTSLEMAEAEEAQDAAAIAVTDMMGREIRLEKPADCVVALTAADCEILYALGVGDTIVGRGEYCDYPAEVLEIPAVQSGAETNIEQIIALAPQVVVMSDMAQTEGQVVALEKAGIQVVMSNVDDIAGVYESISLLGAVMGRDSEAQALIDGMKDTFTDLSEKADGNGEKTVYFEVSPLEYGLWAAGSGTFMNEIAELLGLRNCFADVADWGAISEEQVIERNPDYIVTVTMYFGDGPTPEEEILNRTGWENITAVRNSAILNLQNNELSRPSPRLVEGAQLLFDFVYG